MKNVTIPEHTYQQAKDKLGWTRKQTDELATMASLNHSSPVPSEVVSKLFAKHKRANTITTFSNALFVFAGSVVASIYTYGEV